MPAFRLAVSLISLPSRTHKCAERTSGVDHPPLSIAIPKTDKCQAIVQVRSKHSKGINVETNMEGYLRAKDPTCSISPALLSSARGQCDVRSNCHRRLVDLARSSTGSFSSVRCSCNLELLYPRTHRALSLCAEFSSKCYQTAPCRPLPVILDFFWRPCVNGTNMVARVVLPKTFRAPMRNGGDGSDNLWDLNSARLGIPTELLRSPWP